MLCARHRRRCVARRGTGRSRRGRWREHRVWGAGFGCDARSWRRGSGEVSRGADADMNAVARSSTMLRSNTATQKGTQMSRVADHVCEHHPHGDRGSRLMRDVDVRVALHEWLREQHHNELSQMRIVDELAIAGQVRVDTAVLNGSFAGFEIKSASDTLRRLPRQVEVYSAVLDYATLVVARNHAAKARQLLPRWWGVMEAVSRTSGDPVVLRTTREPKPNPHFEPRVLSTLLWRSEALDELELRGIADGVRSKPNQVLWNRLCDSLDPQEVRQIVRERLKARSGWRAETPPLQCA
ncbi:sce7726 family protein [Microbacterium sp. NPDC058389]|uniref:sce7726 family protein n=1 Tax=Microbacterium sp. NPDC058389 TaxID=3346475 RepID=UPI003654C5C6